jgi:Ca-activated chloride channel homolog
MFRTVIATGVAAGLAAGGLAVATAQTASQANVMFIFDASGSMKRPAGNETRMSAAKRTFGETLASMPKEVQTGLIVYGHRRKNDCSDIEVVSPIGADSASAQAKMVSGFEAIGETPIAAAITRAGDAMRAFKGQQNSIVLVTDGIEECRGDPCAAAAALKNLGINVKVHVVGFALGAGESNKLQCVVDQTGGKYFDATDVTALRRTLAEVKQMVTQAPQQPKPVTAQVPPPTPVVRASKMIFEDKFDGKDLAGNWEVLNAKPDRYIVEKGELLMVNPGTVGFGQKDAANIMRLKDELPDGDWDIIVDAKLQFQSNWDGFSIGLMNDDKNYLAVTATHNNTNICSKTEVTISRMSGGEETRAPRNISGSGCNYDASFGREDPAPIIKAMEANGVQIVLMKRDRKYSATYEVKGWRDAKGQPRKVTTDELTSLRIPGRIALHVGKIDGKRPSETGVRIEQIQVRAYE